MSNRDELREAKEALLSEGLLAPAPRRHTLPAPIERSWRRSISQGVSPDRSGLTEPAPNERDERLVTAAGPVLMRLAQDVAEMGVGVVLSDAAGLIIDRYVPDVGQRAQLDRVGAVVGSNFAEHAVGTNGLGSVIEERAPLFVRGAEHFIDALAEVACAGVPVFDPGTRRIRGSVSLTCTATKANPLMLTLAHCAARDIEQRLMDGRSRGLMDLASAFAAATSRSTGAIALLTPSTVLANTSGLSYVSPANHAAIWDRLVRDKVEQPALLRFELTEGRVDVRAERVHVADQQLAFQVAFSPVRHRIRHERTWHPLPNVHDELASAAAGRPVVAIVGAPGTGKATCARRMTETGEGGCQDIDLAHLDDPGASWVERLDKALASGARVLLRHLHGMPDSQLPRLHAVLDAVHGHENASAPVRLLITLDPALAGPSLMALVERSASVVELPRLAGMRSVIPLLVQSMINERAPAERCVISAPAMQELINREWPGNIGELRQQVQSLIAQHPGAMVGRSDLAPSGATLPGGRVLSPIERAERTAILQALREAQGNRAAAARILRIGRTTLYRKLRALRIDEEVLTG